MKNNRLQELHRILLKQNIPFVSYRLPRNTETITLIQHCSFPEKIVSFDDVKDRKGFIISPFSEKNGHPAVFLKPELILKGNEIDNEIILEFSKNDQFSLLKKLKNNYQTTTREEYISTVCKITSGIKSSDFQKVVLSKVKTGKINTDFHAEDFFSKLCEKYPSAMVYLFQLPETGCWAGATPETLLTVENEVGKTVSLAGTQKAANQSIENYTWSEKEVNEQKIVTDFIENTLKNSEIKNFQKTGPINIQAANLIHLQTEFEFPMDETKNQIATLISKLHPTPSVGGLPTKEALNFIFKNERHDRSYYTGFIGAVNLDNKTNLFVNLRCVQLFDNEYVLYSGAGITSSSVGENEWEETENKFKTMEDVLMN